MFVLAAVGVALAVFRWIWAKSRRIGLMVGAGLLLRMIGGISAFSISYFDLPVLRGLHTGGGFWALALDSQLYYRIASMAAATSPFSIGADTSSPGYTIPLAMWLTGTGISVLSAILFNTACYLATAAVLVTGWRERDRGPAATWTPVMVAAFTFSPVLLLTSAQVLKDPFFALLIAMACRAAFALFESARRPIAERRAPVFLAAGASVVLLTLIGAVRAYYAVFLWLAFLAGFVALFSGRRMSAWTRSGRALAGLLVLASLWIAFANGVGPYYSYYQAAFAGNGVTNEIEASRRSFVTAGGGTNMEQRAAAPTASPSPANQAPPAFSPGRALKGAVMGLLATFVPMSLLKMTALMPFAGGKGLLLVADLDTIFLDVVLVLAAIGIWRQRAALFARAPAAAFIFTLAGLSTVLLAYVVTNFGTLLRLRLFVAAPIWMALLAAGSGDARPVEAPAVIRVPAPRRPLSPRVPAWLCVAAFLVLLLLPGAPDSPFSGVPLTWMAMTALTAGLAALAFVALIRPTRRISDWWIAALVLVAMLKAAVAFGATPSGWRGIYEIAQKPQNIPVYFADGLASQAYRLDKQVDFDGATFKFPFAHDPARYGRPSGTAPREDEAALHVRWVGYVSLPAPAPLNLSARCRGLMTIFIENKPFSTTECPAQGFGVTVPELPAGVLKIAVVYDKPAGTVPLAAFSLAGDRRIEPFRFTAGADTRSTRSTVSTTVVGWAGVLITMLALVWSYWPARAHAPPRLAVRLSVFGASVVLLTLACFTAFDYRDVTTRDGASQAVLSAETHAKDQVIAGARPWQAGSPYVYTLAAAHRVLGGDLSAVVFLNITSLAAILPCCWLIGWRRLGGSAMFVAAPVVAAFCAWYAWPLVRTSTDAMFFTAVAFLAAAVTARAMESRAALVWLGAVVATALAVATRPSFAIYAVAVAVLFTLTRRAVFSIWLALAAAMAAGAILAGPWTWGARAELPLLAVLLFGATVVGGDATLQRRT